MPTGNPHMYERPHCEVCGSSAPRVVLSRPFIDPSVADFLRSYYGGRVNMAMVEGAAFTVLQCKECGFYWQQYVLDDEGLMLLYSQWISPEVSKEKRKQSNTSLPAGYAREMMTAGKLCNVPAHTMRVLDYGMGWGRWCLMAKAFGYEAHGTELDQERIAYAKEQGIHIANVESLPTEHFHFINSEQSFEHIPNPRENIRKLARALAPGGVLRIAVPNADRTIHLLKKQDWKATKDAFHPLEHINSFTHASLVRLGKEAGLIPIRRPAFPLVALSMSSLLKGLLAGWYYGRRGTVIYFRKP